MYEYKLLSYNIIYVIYTTYVDMFNFLYRDIHSMSIFEKKL